MAYQYDDHDGDRIDLLRWHASEHGPQLPVARQQALRGLARELTPGGPLSAMHAVAEPAGQPDALGPGTATPAADRATDDLLPLLPRGERGFPTLMRRAPLAGWVDRYTPRGPLGDFLQALDDMAGEADPVDPAAAADGLPAPGGIPAWLARLRDWFTRHRQPALIVGFAMVATVAVVLPWALVPPAADLHALYGDQRIEELMIVSDDLAPPTPRPPGRRLWLSFAEPAMGDITRTPDSMIRLGIALGALQVLALSEPGAPPGELQRTRALLQQLDSPVALPTADAWADLDTRMAFLSALREFALDHELIAELHYGLWLEKLYLYLARSLEEVIPPGDLPAQAGKILAGIDSSAIAPGELQLLETIAAMTGPQLAGLAPDSRIREMISRVRDILDSRIER